MVQQQLPEAQSQQSLRASAADTDAAAKTPFRASFIHEAAQLMTVTVQKGCSCAPTHVHCVKTTKPQPAHLIVRSSGKQGLIKAKNANSMFTQSGLQSRSLLWKGVIFIQRASTSHPLPDK